MSKVSHKLRRSNITLTDSGTQHTRNAQNCINFPSLPSLSIREDCTVNACLFLPGTYMPPDFGGFSVLDGTSFSTCTLNSGKPHPSGLSIDVISSREVSLISHSWLFTCILYYPYWRNSYLML